MILALETATAACSAAIFDAGGRLLAEEVALGGPAHSQRLLPGAQAALESAGADIAAVESVVVSLGPGAFTGLRIGVATARALALATGARLGGVPTLEALAQELAARAAGADATTFIALVDGRRREVFAGCFRRVAAASGSASGQPSASSAGPAPPPALLEPAPGLELAVVPADDLGDFLSAWPGAVVGGDGALLYAERLPAVVVHDRAVAAPTAAMVGRTWLAGSPRVREGLADVLPIYGRRPDATPVAARTRPTGQSPTSRDTTS